jgi:uncharacterized surface protein with fasciclin (FAS1) repeats
VLIHAPQSNPEQGLNMNKLILTALLAISTVSFAADPKPMAGEKPAGEMKAGEMKGGDMKGGDMKMADAKKDIVDTAVAAGSFKTLATALTEAGLIEVLKGPGPFTVFAPTDEAFAKVPKKTLEALLKDKKQLTKVLTYHVVSGKVMAADVVAMKDGSKVKTVEGSEFKLTNAGGKVKVDAANVTKTDIECSNGVIHVIDAVIMPKK